MRIQSLTSVRRHLEVNRTSDPAVMNDVPVACEEGEGQPGERITCPNPGNEMVQQRQSEKRNKIERPYSEDAVYIERFDVNSAGSLSLAKQQLRDQKRAEQKENRDTERADIAYPKEPWMVDRIGGHVVHAVETEHAQEGEET